MAVGFGGTALSANLTDAAWAPASTGITTDLNAVAYGNGRFVAVGSGATILTSPDGTSWTKQSLGADTDLSSVAYGPAGFVAIGNSGSAGAIFTSADGVTWAPAKSPTANTLVRVIFANCAFVAVGSPGVIVTSTDGGFNWTQPNSGTSSLLEGVAFGANSFVAVGAQGAATQSAAAAARLVNLSARASAGQSAGNLTVGFVASGSAPKQVLVRGIGPSLTQFGVTGALANTQLTLFGGNSVPIAANARWGGAADLATIFAQVYAFPLDPTSLDSALVQALAPGSYTATVGSSTATGNALAEIYDVTPDSFGARLINLSCRAQVGTGASILVAGFSIAGNTSETLVVRGVGPGLAQFGILGGVANPVLTLYNSAGAVLQSNAGWGGNAALAQAFAQVGAFTLPAGSADSALLVTLPPGVYSAQVTAPTGDGTALIELYEVR